MNVPRETFERLQAFGVSRETITGLGRYVALLCVWNSRINLVSPASEQSIWDRHVLDSLQLLPLIPVNTARGIDIGSGAGFPGLLLSAAARIPFDLVEADRRKAAFLGEAARLLQAPITVRCQRIESCALAPAGLITSRAVAPLKRLLALAAPALETGGIGLFPKGAAAEHEIKDAALEWTMKVERFTSVTDPVATVLRISELARA